MAASGVVDVDEDKAACAAGDPSDIFCPYLAYWPDGSTIALDEPIEGLKDDLAMGLHMVPAFIEAKHPEVTATAVGF